MKLSKCITLMALGLFSTLGLWGQDEIIGYVVNEEGYPLVGATLAIYNGNQLVKGCATDKYGEFAFSMTEFDRIEVNYLGYGQEEISHKTLVQDNWIVLKETACSLEEIVVLAFKDYRRSCWTRCGRVGVAGDQEKIIEQASYKSMTIFPNPAKNYVQVEFKEEVAGVIEVISSSGALLYAEKVGGIMVNLDLSSYPSGTYYIRHILDVEHYLIGEVHKID